MSSAVERITHRLRAITRDPNPLLVKELRTIFRTKLFIRFLYLSTGLLGLIVLSGGAATAAGPIPPAQVGQIVFQLFFTTALAVLSLVAPAHASTSLTGEKEMRTYESLILTGMDPWRIVRGKFLASYSAIVLVLVAFAPVVGIAFLFGGISPWHVLIGFYGLLLCLGPAVALGVAISARMRSSRIAILISLMVFAPISFFGTLSMWGLGEAAKRAWGLGMSGPFWFTEALSSRLFELDTLGLLGVLPLFVVGMAVWFLLAAAVAGVRPAAEDRSTPFKLWTVASLVGGVPILFGIITLFDRSDVGMGGVVMVGSCSWALGFYALLFMNEPPLAPRLYEQRSESFGPLRRALGIFGPGAAPTTRFALVSVGAASLSFGIAGAAARYVVNPGGVEHLQFDAALVVLIIGHGAIGAFMVTLGALLRVILRSGVAARVLTLAIVLAFIILPFLFSVIIDPGSLDDLDDTVPFLVRLSPVFPSILSASIASDGESWRVIEVLITAIVYGLGALLFWGALEGRVRSIKSKVVEQRAARDATIAARAAAKAEAGSMSSPPPEPPPGAGPESEPESEPPEPEPEPESEPESEVEG